VVSLALWLVPLFRPVLTPLIYFNTHIHELCHALVGMATGGYVDRIIVQSNGNGHALIGGGNLILTASAGYVGSAIVGAIMIAGARNGKGARGMLLAGAAFLAISMAMFVRGDLVGVISGLLWTLALAAAGLRLPVDWRMFAAQFVGVQLCLTSAHALLTLLNLSISSEAMTDAETLERVTQVPGILWAAGWFAVSAVAVGLSLRRAWARPAS
jgi:hypothetical protein